MTEIESKPSPAFVAMRDACRNLVDRIECFCHKSNGWSCGICKAYDALELAEKETQLERPL